VLRQDEFHPVSCSNLKQACQVGRTRWGGQFRCSRRHWLTGLRKEVDVKGAWRVHDQQPPRLPADVPECVDLTVWHSNEITRLRVARLRSDTELEGAVEDVERPERGGFSS
jgi:hypothetical protein